MQPREVLPTAAEADSNQNRISAILPANEFKRFARGEIEQTIPDRFEAQVRKYPDHIAVKTRETQLTYAELNASANRVAHAILDHLKPGRAAVAILLEQGCALVGAILGVLKTGRPYVGIDPAHAMEGSRRTLDHSQAEFLITNHRNLGTAAQLVQGTGCVVIDVDSLETTAYPANPDITRSPDDLAYIYYTSGSTGMPKGVMDNHRNVLHNVMRYTNNLKISDRDRLTLVQSVAFSGAVSSLFCAVLNGATSFPIDLHADGIESVAAWLVQQRITIYHSVPSIFQRLLATGRTFPDVRVIRLEGDQSTLQHVDLFKQHFGSDVTLVNGLGATETGISYQYPIRTDTRIPGSVVPVGYPTSDMEGLILDESGINLESGAVGEIAIKSRYLALGYWRQPELTAERFLPDPAGGPARIYRTGDQGRMRADGCLEYLGRSGRHLKHNGRWVDTHAIESVLGRMDGVQTAVVSVRCRESVATELVAYVVPTANAKVTRAGLRRALAGQIDATAMPSRFMLLESLPLDANGKIKRSALPAPSSDRPELDVPFVPPSTPQELALARIWCEVLKIDKVGVNDPFHELGGDSLQAIELASLIERNFGIRLPASALIEAPTIAALAARLATAGLGNDCVVTLNLGATRKPFFIMHDGYGDVITYGDLARLLDADQPVYGMRARGLDGKEPPRESVEEMAAAYAAEIRKIQPSGPYFFGGNCFGGLLAFEVARNLSATGEKIGLLALIDTAFPTGWVRSRAQWYLRRAARKLLFKGVADLSRLAGRLSKRALLKIARTLIPALRSVDAPSAARRVVLANARALWRYRAANYDGPAVVICVGAPHNHRAWTRRIRTGLRFLSLPTTGTSVDDNHIAQPPHLENLAAALRELLRDTAER